MSLNRRTSKIEIVKFPKDNSPTWSVILTSLSLFIAILALYYSAESTSAALKSTEIAFQALNDQRKKILFKPSKTK